MPKDKDTSVKPSPLGNFFSKITNRMRSKSPAATGKENLDDDKFKCPRNPTAPSTPSSRFGTLVGRLSTRNKKLDRRDVSLERDARDDNVRPTGTSPRRTVTFASSPRPAMSENDLRHVTLSRGGSDVPVTPLVGASQFMSEDNLASAECGTPAHRVPSYLRVSCALNGYSKSPRNTEISPVKAMGMSLVERRLQRFQPSNHNDSICSSTTASPIRAYPSCSAESYDLPMGANYSTPSPVKSLIGQFDRLNLCSTDKDDCKENEKPKLVVVDQPLCPPNQVHPMKGDFTVVSSTIVDSDVIGKTLEDLPTALSTDDDEPRPSTSSHDAIENDVSSLSNGDDAVSSTTDEVHQNGDVTSTKKDSDECQQEECDSAYGSARSGEGFRRKLEDTRIVLQKQCEQAEKELEENPSLPDVAASSLRMASGKARLLIRKKLGKFEELVNKNMNPVEGDPQPALLDDLEGYWALVEIELGDIENCFQEVDRLRINGWVDVEEAEDQPDGCTRPLNNNVEKSPAKPRREPPRVPPKKKEEDTEKEEKAKAVAAARRKQMAEMKARKRQEMQEQQQKDQQREESDGVMVI